MPQCVRWQIDLSKSMQGGAMSKRVRVSVLAVLVSALVGCGGGSAEGTGDVTSYLVDPAEFTYIDCTTGIGGSDAVTVHVISGGQEPFRIKPTGPVGALSVGTVNASGVFTAASSFNSEGYWVLDGRDPSFAIRVNAMGCGSSIAVKVLDGNSNPVNVTIVSEEADI